MQRDSGQGSVCGTRSNRGRSVDRRGLTLIEVIVALAVSGLVLLAARQLIEGVSETARRIATPAREAERDANAEQMLRSLVGRAEIGPGMEFTGDPWRVRFMSWCDVPGGWQARCVAAVAVDSLGGRPAVVAVLSTGETHVIRTGFAVAELRYLSDASRGGRWLEQWGTGLTPPLAIGLITDADTMIVRLGERG